MQYHYILNSFWKIIISLYIISIQVSHQCILRPLKPTLSTYIRPVYYKQMIDSCIVLKMQNAKIL